MKMDSGFHRTVGESPPCRIPAGQRLFHQGLLGLLLVYTAWVWAGLRPSFHWVGVGMALLLLGGWIFAGPAVARRKRFCDPVFWLGGAFLVFLALQWANAGREQYFDVGYQQWRYTLPPWPNWPSAFSRPDAMQVWSWFFPAWVIALSLRSDFWQPEELRHLLTACVCSAGGLALFGLVQFAAGTSSIYWVQPMKEHFFASFPYGNHAAPYFVLLGAVSVGLIYREVLDVRRKHRQSMSVRHLHHPWRIALLTTSLLLCLIGANLAFSRSGVILSWMLGGVILLYGFIGAWQTLPPANRINFSALTAGTALLLYFAVVGFGEHGIQKEFTLKESGSEEAITFWERVDLELGGRPRFAWAAVEIWREHPWYGVGGWGYKYLVAEHVSPELWKNLRERGWANVHFDFLQFLAEFGLIGFSLLLGTLGILVRDLWRAREQWNSLYVMSGFGLVLVLVFSMIDLPFRCPAVLYAWVAVLSALPRLTGGRRGKIDWLESHEESGSVDRMAVDGRTRT